MDQYQFSRVMTQPRNGCNRFFRHPLVRDLQYSDGVRDAATLGCYWLLDIIGTEATLAMRRARESLLSIHVRVDHNANPMVQITGTGSGSRYVWRKAIRATDMPNGSWYFELADEGERFALILQTEH